MKKLILIPIHKILSLFKYRGFPLYYLPDGGMGSHKKYLKFILDTLDTDKLVIVEAGSGNHSTGLFVKELKNTNYRLACGIVTNDAAKALRASKELKVGQFNFNGPPGYRTEAAPFGGFGDSGNGEKEGIILAARGMRRIRTFYRH